MEAECISTGHAAGQDELAGTQASQALAEGSPAQHHKGVALILWTVMLDMSGSQRILLALQTHVANFVPVLPSRVCQHQHRTMYAIYLCLHCMRDADGFL